METTAFRPYPHHMAYRFTADEIDVPDPHPTGDRSTMCERQVALKPDEHTHKNKDIQHNVHRVESAILLISEMMYAEQEDGAVYVFRPQLHR